MESARKTAATLFLLALAIPAFGLKEYPRLNHMLSGETKVWKGAGRPLARRTMAKRWQMKYIAKECVLEEQACSPGSDKTCCEGMQCVFHQKAAKHICQRTGGEKLAPVLCAPVAQPCNATITCCKGDQVPALSCKRGICDFDCAEEGSSCTVKGSWSSCCGGFQCKVDAASGLGVCV